MPYLKDFFREDTVIKFVPELPRLNSKHRISP